MMLFLTVLCGLVVGVSLGLTGGGGSILAVPLLVYVLAVPPREAVSVSLAAVGATAIIGAVGRFLRGDVELKTGLLFATSGMLGAPLGTWIGGYVSETMLLMLFAALMVLVAARMWIKASRSPADVTLAIASTYAGPADETGPACRRDPTGNLPLNSRCLVVLLVSGILTGVLAGLFGVGGGFVIVPALVLLTNLDIRRAVATSLLVIAIISGAGLASHLLAGRSVAMETLLPFTAGGIVGLVAGSWAGRHMSPVHLQKIFAVVIVGVAIYVLARGAG